MFDFPSIQKLAIQVPVFLLALTIHECAHGWVAYRLGDPTAKQQGRLTLNPLAHLDIIGLLAIVFIHFGWAKPVPVDARYFRQPRRDMVLVAVAGPLSNAVLAVAAAFCFQMFPWRSVLTPGSAWLVLPVARVIQSSVLVNVILAVFNLLPIPPLDGSRVVSGLLPLPQAIAYSRVEPYGFIILFLLFFSGAMDHVLWPPVQFLTMALFRMWG